MAKRLICIVLSVLMIMTVLPAGVIADTTGTALTSSGGSLSSGNYYLSGDLTLSTDITIPSGAEVTIDLNGYTLTGTGNSSVITVNGTLTLNDTSSESTGTITGGTGQTGSAVSYNYGGGGILVTGTLIMNGGTISENNVSPSDSTAWGGGVCVSGSGASFTMNGGTISSNSATVTAGNSAYGGGVYVGSGASFVMNGGTISSNSVYIVCFSDCVACGGGVHNEGTFTMNGGTITGNDASTSSELSTSDSAATNTVNAGARGGGVCNYSTGTFNLVDGIISNNLATAGGGVYSSGTFNMSGGSITGNVARGSANSNTYGGGGGVYLQGGTFSMSSGSITNNKDNSNGANAAHGYGGGVRVMNSTTVVITGGTITGNTSYSGSYDNCIYNKNSSGGSITISGGTFDSATVVTTYATVEYSTNGDGTYTVGASSADYLASVTSSTDSSVTKYESVSAAITAAGEGDIVTLLKDVTENITIDYTDTITLDLAGYTLTGSITITGGNLTLKDDSEEETGTVTGGVTVNAKTVSGQYYVLTATYGSYIIPTSEYSTYVTSIPDGEGESTYYGIYDVLDFSSMSNIVGNYLGSFTLSSGSINGGISVKNGSSFAMNGGTISGHTATNGGGVNLANITEELIYIVTLNENGVVTSYTESITTNYPNKFTMTGGTISGNTATQYGGGVYVGENCIFIMSGGIISGNSASVGGGVYVSYGDQCTQFSMTAATICAIYNNTASTNAADIYVYDIKKLSLISASSMTDTDMDFTNYVWYTDGADARYGSTVTDTVDVTSMTEGAYLSLVAAQTVATPELYGRTLTLDGAIGVTFYFSMDGLTASDYTMSAVVDDDGSARKITGITASDETKVIGGVTYYRYTVYVYATELAKEISVTLYDGDSVSVGTYTYSVKQYCEWAINGNKSSSELCKALLNYGDAAVTYFADGTYYDNSGWLSSVSSSWSDEYLSSVTDTDASTEGDKPDEIGTISASLGLSSANDGSTVLENGVISMNFYVNVSSENVDSFTFKINDTVVEPTYVSDGLYSLSVQIPAKDMMNGKYVLSIGDSYTVTYTVNQYISATLALSTDSEDSGVINELTNRKNLVKAMYLLSNAASTYTGWV
ncbi:MAG: hypothetical protein LUE20_08680 [Oscillospiraceae bacterium]|nr:hypothetical protein [Oscillospiraceae bacterium]